MKKFLSFLLVAVMILSFAACGSSKTAETEDANTETAMEQHIIAVMVFNYSNEEQVSFREYLENYIASCFEVKFVYSDNVTTEDEAKAFIDEAAEYGAEGIMSFVSYDLQAEVEACEAKDMYYMMASATVSDDEFTKVSDNPYFLGVIGPGSDVEYQAGADMAEHFISEHEGDEYFILSGGASMGNEMHLERTVGILDTLQEKYGVTFDQSSEEIASSMEPVHAEAGNLKVCVCGGYLDMDDFLQTARDEYAKDHYGIVLSVLPLAEMSKSLDGAVLGLIDSYNQRNLQLFNDGTLDYLTGKYSSLIGPSFAAMYNAITGHADDFREDGKAFTVEQGFWTSTDLDDFTEKYTFSNSIEINAYNYEDLQSVISIYNEDADLEGLKSLAAAYTYEEVLERRIK